MEVVRLRSYRVTNGNLQYRTVCRGSLQPRSQPGSKTTPPSSPSTVLTRTAPLSSTSSATGAHTVPIAASAAAAGDLADRLKLRKGQGEPTFVSRTGTTLSTKTARTSPRRGQPNLQAAAHDGGLQWERWYTVAEIKAFVTDDSVLQTM